MEVGWIMEDSAREREVAIKDLKSMYVQWCCSGMKTICFLHTKVCQLVGIFR